MIEKNSKSYYGHKLLGEIYEKEGNLEVATQEYIRASNIRPEDDNIQYKIAYLFNEIDNKDGAVKILKELLQKKPEWEAATFLLYNIILKIMIFIIIWEWCIQC